MIEKRTDSKSAIRRETTLDYGSEYTDDILYTGYIFICAHPVQEMKVEADMMKRKF